MDDLTETVIERLHAAPDAFRGLVREVAAARPDLPARALVAALEGAAAALDGTLRRTGRPVDQARTARRLALLLAQDVDRVAVDTEDPTLADVARHWRAVDDFFLRL